MLNLFLSISNAKNLREYETHYGKSDLLLLADVMNSHRNKGYNDFKLDPLYCITSPSFTQKAMLKYTKAEIKLFKDINMHLLIERGIRGGICDARLDYCKANNKYINSNFDPKTDKSYYIVSFDVNSQYSTVTKQKSLYNNYKWIEDLSIFTNNFIENNDENGDTYYILEVDNHCPRKMHIFLMICHF